MHNRHTYGGYDIIMITSKLSSTYKRHMGLEFLFFIRMLVFFFIRLLIKLFILLFFSTCYEKNVKIFVWLMAGTCSGNVLILYKAIYLIPLGYKEACITIGRRTHVV